MGRPFCVLNAARGTSHVFGADGLRPRVRDSKPLTEAELRTTADRLRAQATNATGAERAELLRRSEDARALAERRRVERIRSADFSFAETPVLQPTSEPSPDFGRPIVGGPVLGRQG